MTPEEASSRRFISKSFDAKPILLGRDTWGGGTGRQVFYSGFGQLRDAKAPTGTGVGSGAMPFKDFNIRPGDKYVFVALSSSNTDAVVLTREDRYFKC